MGYHLDSDCKMANGYTLRYPIGGFGKIIANDVIFIAPIDSNIKILPHLSSTKYTTTKTGHMIEGDGRS